MVVLEANCAHICLTYIDDISLPPFFYFLQGSLKIKLPLQILKIQVYLKYLPLIHKLKIQTRLSRVLSLAHFLFCRLSSNHNNLACFCGCCHFFACFIVIYYPLSPIVEDIIGQHIFFQTLQFPY